MKPARRNVGVLRTSGRVALASALVLSGAPARGDSDGAKTDVSNVPLIVSGAEKAKPNFMFILDDSNSMELEYMPGPDDPNSGAAFKKRHAGSFSVLCNKIYFNPDSSTPYTLPPNPAKGVSNNDADNFRPFDAPSFSNAPVDGFVSNAARTSLGAQFGILGMAAGEVQQAFYYRYELGDDPNVLHGNYTPCWMDNNGFADTVKDGNGKTVWTKIRVGSGDEERFARWYSFYRTRFNVMKSAAGLAFAYPTIDESIRVGMITIAPNVDNKDPTSAIKSDKFLPPRDFTLAQRAVWLSSLYAQRGNFETPLRAALSRVGRYYGGASTHINNGMIDTPAEMPGAVPDLPDSALDDLFAALANGGVTQLASSANAKVASFAAALKKRPDPVQYSCQRNFSLLTTDGYWNGDAGWQLSPANGNGPPGIITEDSGNAVPRPMNDQYVVRKVDARSEITNSMVQNAYPGWRNADGTMTPLTSSGSSTFCDFGSNAENFLASDAGDSDVPLPACSGALNAPSKGGKLPKWIEVFNSGSSANLYRPHPEGYPPELKFAEVVDANTKIDCSGCTDAPARTKIVGAQEPVGTQLRNLLRSGGTSAPFDLWWESDVRYNDGWPRAGTAFGARKHGNYFIGCMPIKYTCGSTEAGPIYSDSIRFSAIRDDVTSFADDDRLYPKRINGPYTPKDPVTASDVWYTLADVAMYYYNTDLRDSSKFKAHFGNDSNGNTANGNPLNVAKNNVPTSSSDAANWQHMVTFTMGLGVSGNLRYNESYKTGGAPDYSDIVSGAKSWIDWYKTNDEAKIDDLWHAAVNGRGTYLSAANATEAVKALNRAIDEIQKRDAGGGAASTSNLEPKADDNAIYWASYTSLVWSGEITRQGLDVNNIAGGPAGTPIKASSGIDSRVKDDCDDRQIYFQDGSKLSRFTWNSKRCSTGTTDTDLSESWRDLLKSPTSGSFQSNSSPRAESNLVNYLRGQRGFEIGRSSLTSMHRYRARDGSVLGDIVNSQPLFVRRPVFNYVDDGYADFKAKWSGNASATPPVPSRAERIYIGSNDGMLHAFDADTLQEKWAIVPSALADKLSLLAAPGYKRAHRFYVDGSPVGGDVFDPALPGTNAKDKWRSIFVVGYNAGGRGYMAVDVTDPDAAPKPLWEFVYKQNCPNDHSISDGKWCDDDLGMTYGNPIITKVRDANTSKYPGGRWVVIFASGYNNKDDRGYLYIVDANTGALLKKVDSGRSPTNDTEVGLAKISAWTDNGLANNLAEYVYGGTLRGEMVRFDFATGWSNATANRIATFEVGGKRQPITTRPELGLYQGKRMVFAGTGRFLGESDLADLTKQSVYGLVDDNIDPATPISRADLQSRSFTAAANDGTQSIDNSTLSSTKGWYIDLPNPGERIFTDLQLQLGTLVFISNAPSDDPCTPGGKAYLNYVSYGTGGTSDGANGSVARLPLGDIIGVGLGLARVDPSGNLIAITGTSDGGKPKLTDLGPKSSVSQGKRVNWREIMN